MKKIFTLILLLTTASAWSQNIEFKKGNFKDNKEGFEKAKENK